MREFVFATTSPDDAKATDLADRVEQLLRSEGHDIRVILYGWGQLQQRIAHHPRAYVAFNPQAQSTSVPQLLPAATPHVQDGIEAAVEAALRRALKPELLAGSPATEPSSADRASEDPALHARIDSYRDAFAKDGLVAYAQRSLLELEEKADLEQKPWAKFRIISNLASIAFACGREAEAIARFEAAYDVLPNDAAAIANLALARTMQERFTEAFQLAQNALATIPRSDQAVCYLLQAAARSNWQGDPETLIPPDLAGSVHADLGLAEFCHRREMPGWQQRSIEIANRHPDVADFRPTHAIAVLALALDSGSIIAGGLGPVSSDDLTQAANEMKDWIERMLELGIGTEFDKRAHLNNACVLLRLNGRDEEVEQLLGRAGKLVDGDSVLKRLLAVVQIAQGKRAEAIATLRDDTDAENVLFHAELIAPDDASEALEQALAVQAEGLADRLKSLRAQMVAELAMRLGREDEFSHAVLALRSLEPNEPLADLLELRAQKHGGLLTADDYGDALKALATSISDQASIMGRTLLATELQDADYPAEASVLLEGRVDLSRVTQTSVFYLHTLAAARRDETFYRALDQASETLRNHPEILWFRSAHAWNAGDLAAALQTVNQLIGLQPLNARARIFKIEVLLRQNDSSGVVTELEQPLEQLATLALSDSFRVAMLLRHFGFTERAADFAYRLYLANQENARAWMTLAGIVFADSGGVPRPSAWDVSAVGPDAAVDLTFDNGDKRFFIVEADQQVRKLDSKSWEPNHPLIKTVSGLAKDERFCTDQGLTGTITDLRHKIVARFHEVLAHYETRFPDQNDLRSMRIDPGQPGGLDELKAKLKQQSEWVQHEQEQWRNGHWPLGLLALRLHMGILDVAGGLAAQGIKLKVATGDQADTDHAIDAIATNAGRGCVLDLHSFWTSWRMRTLEVIEAVGGPIHVGRGVIDRLQARRESFGSSSKSGRISASFDRGQISIVQTSAEIVQESLGDLDRAIAWLEKHAKICPVVVSDELPPLLRDHMTIGHSDLYDALTLAIQRDLLLVTDDMPTRDHGRILGSGRSCWTQIVLRTALHSNRLDAAKYVKSMASLLEAGHNYLGVSGSELAVALKIDLESGNAPGRLFDRLSGTIGGKDAEPQSHVAEVAIFLSLASRASNLESCWENAASILVRKLLRWRHTDYVQMMCALIIRVRNSRDLVNFLITWAGNNHVSPDQLLGELRKWALAVQK